MLHKLIKGYLNRSDRVFGEHHRRNN